MPSALQATYRRNASMTSLSAGAFRAIAAASMSSFRPRAENAEAPLRHIGLARAGCNGLILSDTKEEYASSPAALAEDPFSEMCFGRKRRPLLQ